MSIIKINNFCVLEKCNLIIILYFTWKKIQIHMFIAQDQKCSERA